MQVRQPHNSSKLVLILQVYKGTVIVAGGYTKEEGNKAIESGAPDS